ncbi:hypothetical protein C1H46_009392 [Malus baccata]|uniref:Uncharacterized protein n=1 Tax=Malus baccata TaxID=106549 RepID=A0A540N1J6_MALBA|nr:hypothetical protein C1H46_009392 [Malus baccata]
MLERPRRCCEGTAMGVIILYFQSGLGIDPLTGNQIAMAGIDRCPGHGRGLRALLLQPHLRKRLHRGDEVALLVVAEEAFTGVLDSGKGQMNAIAEWLKEFSRDDLLKLMAKGSVL